MIDFIYTSDFVLSDQEQLRKLLLSISEQEGYTLSQLCYHFVSTEKIISINSSHLSHNYATDVITFDYSTGKTLTVEAYVCCEQVYINAKTHTQTFENEMVRVLIHALLHVCGYDDKTTIASEKMTEREDFYINEYLTSFK